MNFSSIALSGLLSITSLFMGLWFGRRVSHFARTRSGLFASGILVYFTVKSLGDACRLAGDSGRMDLPHQAFPTALVQDWNGARGPFPFGPDPGVFP
jgi:hypothetical protein